jgi:intein-encoded DNA endonuclease-like protein
MSYNVSKIIKLERKYPGITNYVDSLRGQGYSYRKIAHEVTRNFVVGVSHETVRQYILIRQGKKSIEYREKKDGELYYRIASIKSKC